MRAQQVNQNLLPNTLLITSHMFTWKVLASAPLHFRKGKILEAFFMTKLKPDLKDQIEHHILSFFRHEFT